jgi:hypothetical protein
MMHVDKDKDIDKLLYENCIFIFRGAQNIQICPNQEANFSLSQHYPIICILNKDIPVTGLGGL